MAYNPYSGQYTPQTELLPNFRRTPPPEILREQAWQTLHDYGYPAAQWAGTQFTQNLLTKGLFGKSLGQMALSRGDAALNSPQALATIAAIQATRAGAPIINGIRNFAVSPYGQKAKQFTEKVVDWIF